jgi:hypothetical protein
MYSKRTFLTLEKKKFCLLGYFGIFTQVFCVIKRVMESFWYFSHFVFNFLIQKLLVRVPLFMLASGWRLHHLGARVTPSSGQIWSSAISLKAQEPHGVACVGL